MTGKRDKLDAMPLGGYKRAKRIWDATPFDLSDKVRLEHVKGILKMIGGGKNDKP